jgi:aminotransferase
MGQIGAIEALKGSQQYVAAMKREYKRRREFIVDSLNEIGLECPKPDGTFYVFPSIKKTSMKSMEFAKGLLRKEKVAVVPGTAFGKEGEGYIRISYASSMSDLKEAAERIKNYAG